MSDRLPLSALLSQALVAFTIEFDNEFEHLVPHRTTDYGPSGGSGSLPWLVSMAIWLHLMQYVPSEGIDAKELYRRTRLPPKAFRTLLIRMSKWWGYLSVRESFVQPTPGGLKALEEWRPLTDVIEKRWQDRFGRDLIDPLRRELQNIVSKTAPDCPDYLPILGYELLSLTPASKSSGAGKTGSISRSGALSVLLSKSLLAFAVEFEHDSGLSLAVCANLLRLTSDEGIRIRDIPRLSGVSKEAIAMALRRAEECGLGMIQSGSPANRIKNCVLTSDGRRAREKYHKLTWNIETGWKTKLGRNSVAELRELLEHIIGDSSTDSLLSKGLRPYAEGWRASLPRAECLPHYPMVLHRGGFPDGS